MIFPGGSTGTNGTIGTNSSCRRPTTCGRLTLRPLFRRSCPLRRVNPKISGHEQKISGLPETKCFLLAGRPYGLRSPGGEPRGRFGETRLGLEAALPGQSHYRPKRRLQTENVPVRRRARCAAPFGYAGRASLVWSSGRETHSHRYSRSKTLLRRHARPIHGPVIRLQRCSTDTTA